jgi:2-keto-4-pentenoate hydratase
VAGTRIAGLASLLVEAHRNGTPVPADPDAVRSADEAYAIQDLVMRALGGGRRAALWKAIPPRGGEPLASPVPPAGCIGNAARLLGVEAEVGFRLGPDLDPAEAVALIELCSTRLADWGSASALWKLADFQSHQAFVIGSGTRDWRDIDFARQSIDLRVNGASRASAVGGHPAGDPSRLLPWLAGHVARRGGLQSGDIVATGSWVGIVAVRPGDEVVARFAGIGEAGLRVPDPRADGVAAG